MPSPKPSTPRAIEDWHGLMEWLLPLLDHFPRTRRFTLATRIENLLLEVLELLIEAAYTTQKHAPLSQANRKLELLRHLWRLSYRLRYINMKRYEHGVRLIDEPGRQIGGWLKSAG